MKLSIIILNWNSMQHLTRCLSSLRDCNVVPRELIVVDNGSSDESIGRLRAAESRGELRLIANDRNLGVGPARNQGFALASGEYILSLDVDTEVRPGAIEQMVATMDAHPEVGVAGACLRGPHGERQYTCGHFPTLQSKLFRQMPQPWRERLLDSYELRSWDQQGRRYVGWVTGASQIIRRTALDEIGAYDPHIFYGPEDVDFCLRMWLGGWAVLYDGGALIIHHEQHITKNLRKLLSRTTREHVKALVYYFCKHRYLFHPPVDAEELARRMDAPLPVSQ